MTVSSKPSVPFDFNFKPLLAKSGLRNRRPETLQPCWIERSTAPFDYSPDSDQPSGLMMSQMPSTAPLFNPLPGPQTKAYESKADIVGYGGGAGGGKSFLEIGLGVTNHRSSIIFRREAKQVRDLWSKLGKVCGVLGRSNENLLIWRDLPGDREVTLAGCKNEGDWKKYQGQGHDLYAFDEATEFSEFQVRTLIAWNRTEIAGQRCRVVLSFNPPTTAEGQWVVDFFGPWLDPQYADPAEPGELRWYAVIDGVDVARPDSTPFDHNGETITPLSRTFIPARLEDNPLLEATGYRATLQNVPEPLRSQLLYGDFTVGLEDDVYQVIPTAWVRAAQARWTADGHDGVPQTAVGVDVAQGGRDFTALAKRRGTWFAPVEKIPGADVPDASENATVIKTALAFGGYAAIDSDGIGASTYHLLRPEFGSRVRMYKGSTTGTYHDASGVFSFLNVRAAAYWHLRELLDPAHYSMVALPPGREVLADLTAPRWIPVGDKIRLEKKDEIHTRLGRSPDVGDAIVMAAWHDPLADLAEAMGQGMNWSGSRPAVRHAARGTARGRR